MAKLTFEQRYDSIVHEIEKRRRGYDLAAVSWDDARQTILIRVWKKYRLFDDKKGPFVNWVNRVISHAMLNIWRDNLTLWSRPCIAGCIFNTGGEMCSKTPSGRQCAECPLYRDWERRKKDHFAVKQPLPLDNHGQETNNIQSDFVDIASKKAAIDEEMKQRLEPQEWRVYKLLMIDGGTEKQAAILLGFKERRKTKNGTRIKTFSGYAKILALRHRFVQIARQIIEEQDLA